VSLKYISEDEEGSLTRRPYTAHENSKTLLRSSEHIYFIRLRSILDLLLGALPKLRRATTSFVMSVRTPTRPAACNNSAPTGRISMKFDI